MRHDCNSTKVSSFLDQSREVLCEHVGVQNQHSCEQSLVRMLGHLKNHKTGMNRFVR